VDALKAAAEYGVLRLARTAARRSPPGRRQAGLGEAVRMRIGLSGKVQDTAGLFRRVDVAALGQHTVRTSRYGWGQAPLRSPRGAWPCPGWPSDDGQAFLSTALSRNDATAPFASSGAFGLVLHWPLCGPEVYLGPYPAK
jgi:hypothetical protein